MITLEDVSATCDRNIRSCGDLFLFDAGSITVQPYDDPSLEPVELGASIFVKVNKNLWRATEEFGLEKTGFEDEDGVMGVWNGEEFLLTVRIERIIFDLPRIS